MKRSKSGSRIIGGMFALELIEGNASSNSKEGAGLFHEPRCLLATARSAVNLLARALRPPTVWLPSYICGVVIDAARDVGTRVRFYPVDESLKISNNIWLAKIEPGDVLMFVDYFGFDTWRSYGPEVKARGARVVEDACQAMLNKDFSPHADYVIVSPRKFVGVPDGGILLARKGRHLPAAEFPAAPPWWLLKAIEASILRSRFDRYNGDRNWFKIFQWVEANGPIEPCRMSDLSAMLLRRIDWPTIKTRRRRNYRFLLAELSDLAMFPVLPREVVPLGFPIRVKDRDRLRRALFRKQIYPAIHWDLTLVPRKFAASHQLANEIMTLPCDQRYGVKEMKRMVAAVKHYISG
jgi:hypothetical protein